MWRRWGLAVAAVLACIVLVIVWRTRSRSKHVEPAGVPAADHAHDTRARAQQQARSSVTGAVRDEADQPIAQARVCVRAEGIDVPRELARTTRCASTDARGSYVITGLSTADYRVTALAQRHLPAQLGPVSLLPDEQRTGVNIVLRAGGVEVSGTVSDLGGGPIAHAEVAALPTTTYQSSATVETDDAGAFRLWVAPGSIGVSAEVDGYTEEIAWGVAPGVFKLVLTPESTLAGTVVDAQTQLPVPGAAVTLLRNSDREHGTVGAEIEDVADDQGRFRFDRLGPDRYSETAIGPHGFGRSDGSVAVGLGQHVDGVVVQLKPAAHVEATVTIAGPPESPCPKPRLYLMTANDEGGRAGHAASNGLVHADGVLPGTYRVRIECDGYEVEGEVPQLEVRDNDITGLHWRMIREAPRATIRGYVRSATGTAVADAIVASGGRQTASRADGAYELTDLDAGTHYLGVTSEAGIGPERGWKVDITAGMVLTQDLTVYAGGTIAGVVLDSDGNPAARVQVTIMYPQHLKAESGADGAFRFDNLRSGTYTVDAAQADGRYKSGHVTVHAGETASVKLVVAAAPGSVSGIVVDAVGKPLGDAFVVAAREIDGYINTRPWSVHDGLQVLASVDGTFTIGHLVVGNYTLRAYRTGGGEVIAEHVPVGGYARLQITRSGSIAGTVRMPTETPVDVTVRLVDARSGFSQQERFYRTDGRYHIDELPPGSYQLTASASDLEGETTATLAEGAKLTNVDIAIDAAGTFTGHVFDLDSRKPVPDVEIHASLVGGPGKHVAQTDIEGRFTITGLPRGLLFVWLRPPEASGYRPVELVHPASGGSDDLGDLVLIRARGKVGDPVGFFGIQFANYSMTVVGIVAGSPASKSDLAVGDVVTAINGVDVSAIEGDAARSLLVAPPGSSIRLGLARGRTIVLVSGPPEVR